MGVMITVTGVCRMVVGMGVGMFVPRGRGRGTVMFSRIHTIKIYPWGVLFKVGWSPGLRSIPAY